MKIGKPVLVVIGFVVLGCGLYFVIKNINVKYKINDANQVSEAVEIAEVIEPKIEEEIYPELPFGDYISIPEDKLNPEEEMKYNGYLLEEYTEGDIFTQIRVHKQVVKLYDEDSYIYRARKNDETITYVYDNPENQEKLFEIEQKKDFTIEKIRRDFNNVTGEISYWLYIIQNDMCGWTLLDKQEKPIEDLYENNYWVPEAVFFPGDKSKKTFHIRNVSAGCYLTSGVSLKNQPVRRNSEDTYLSVIDGEIHISIKKITAEEDLNDTDQTKLWYFIEKEDTKGWYEGEKYFSQGRGGPLIYSPATVITSYYDMGA